MPNSTQISALGRVRFIEKLTAPFSSTIVSGIGDDAAVIERGNSLELVAQTLFLEGIDFDLTYTPLEHLGQKLITAAVSNVVAMNGVPHYVTVGVGLSARFSVEEAESLYRGVERACQRYCVELIGGDTSSSVTGLTLAATCIGSADREQLTLRSGATGGEIICVTGSLGGAYMGLQLLEREKRAGANGESVRSIFESNRYVLSRQLQPVARLDIVELLREHDILPSSMIDITSGLASAVLSICRSSVVGARIHLSRLPLNAEVSRMAEELHCDPIVAILNGGDDYELLFTVDAARHKEIEGVADIHIVGFITEQELGAALVTPDGEAISLTSPDFTITEQ